MKVSELLEYRMETNKDRRTCSACGGTFLPDNPKKPKLEKRCQACRMLDNQKGQSENDEKIENILKAKLETRHINSIINALTPEDNDLSELAGKRELTTMVDKTLSKLSDLEQTVIRMTFGLTKDGEYTYDDVAKLIGRTRARVKQIESSAIKNLKHPKVSAKLLKYISK